MTMRETGNNPNNRPVLPLLAGFDWDDLRVFLALARQRTLSGAARFLSITHATVGRRISSLEQALETKLFERTSDGFLLTDAGEQLLRESEGIEEHILGIANTFSQEVQEAGGAVRVGTMEGIGSLFLAPNFKHLFAEYPNLRVELVTASHWINLSKREADILVSFPKPETAKTTVSRIGEFALFLYASQDFLTQNGEPQTLADLSDFELVTYIDELVQIPAVRWLNEAVPEPHGQFTSTSLIAQFQSTVAGMGVAMLPTFVGETDDRLVRVLPDQVRVMRDIWLAVHDDIAHVRRVRQTVSFLKNLFVEHADYLVGERRNSG